VKMQKTLHTLLQHKTDLDTAMLLLPSPHLSSFYPHLLRMCGTADLQASDPAATPAVSPFMLTLWLALMGGTDQSWVGRIQSLHLSASRKNHSLREEWRRIGSLISTHSAIPVWAGSQV
jgi:hypothetical protein